MFSITVRSGIGGSSWKTTPTPAASDAPGSRGANGLSRSRTSPLSARSTPDMTLTSVDLPAPFSPSSACTSPPRTSKLTSCSACTPANALDRPSAVSSRSRWLIWLSCGIPGLLAGGRPAAGVVIPAAGRGTVVSWSLRDDLRRQNRHERRAGRERQTGRQVRERVDADLNRLAGRTRRGGTACVEAGRGQLVGHGGMLALERLDGGLHGQHGQPGRVGHDEARSA